MKPGTVRNVTIVFFKISAEMFLAAGGLFVKTEVLQNWIYSRYMACRTDKTTGICNESGALGRRGRIAAMMAGKYPRNDWIRN